MNMTMTYDGTMVMPKNFEVVTEDEMTYVDGGWYLEKTWWGFNMYFTHAERQTLTSAQAIAGFISGIIGGPVGVPLAGAIAALGTIIWNYDEGNGVRIRMHGAGKTYVPTGFFSLSAYEERTIASQNRVSLF